MAELVEQRPAVHGRSWHVCRLERPKLLVIDKATVALDPDREEQLIEKAIKRAAGGAVRFDAQPLRFRARDPTWNDESRSGIFGGGMISAPVHVG